MKLFNRIEEKRECNDRTANKLILLLSKLGFEPERSHTITNLVLENPKELNFENYQRVRVRQYSDTPEKLFAELRIRKGERVIKKRIELVPYLGNSLKGFLSKGVFGFQGNSSDLKAIVNLIKENQLIPYVFVEYKRIAFNDFKAKVRITIDSEIKYYSLPKKLIELKKGKFLGGEKANVIKFKYVGKLSAELIAFRNLLNVSKSKIKRATYFLKRARK